MGTEKGMKWWWNQEVWTGPLPPTMYYILWKWGLWKVKVSIMMKAGDKMITYGASPSSHTEKVKVAVFECKSDNNRKWKQLLTYDTSHTLHLWAYSPKRNSFHSSFDTFLYFLWLTPEIIGHLVFLRAFAHRCYLHAVEAFGAALEKKVSKAFLLSLVNQVISGLIILISNTEHPSLHLSNTEWDVCEYQSQLEVKKSSRCQPYFTFYLVNK